MEIRLETTKTFEDLQKNNTIAILRGGTRSGKSYAVLQWLIVKAFEEEGCTISVVRKSFPSLRISALRDFKSIMGELGIWEDSSWVASENTYRFDNGSTMEFLSVQDSERRKGTKRDYLFVDEANELGYDDWFQLFIRTSRKSIMAFNPSFPQSHWIYKQVATHPEAEQFVSTYRDNPFLNESIVREIERLRDTSPSYYRIYGEGEIGIVEGLIFDNINIIDEVPEEAQTLGWGIDFGFTNDPTALVTLFKLEDGILFDEVIYMKGLLSNQIANFIRGAQELWGNKEVIADSADPRLIEEIFRSGVNIKPAVKGKDSILTGIDILKQHKIYITKSSKNLIDEFYSYVWNKNKNEEVLNEPDPRCDDHGIDACRYVGSWFLSQRKRSHGTYSISVR